MDSDHGIKVYPELTGALIDGKPVYLGPLGTALLFRLVETIGKTVSHEDLIFAVYGRCEPQTFMVPRHIFHLRASIQRTRFKIVSVYGSGYRLEQEAA